MLEYLQYHLGIWSSSAIILGFSFFVVFLDEYVIKPMRQRRWEQKAAAGDKAAQELLRVVRSAQVVDE